MKRTRAKPCRRSPFTRSTRRVDVRRRTVGERAAEGQVVARDADPDGRRQQHARHRAAAHATLGDRGDDRRIRHHREVIAVLLGRADRHHDQVSGALVELAPGELIERRTIAVTGTSLPSRRPG